MQLNNRGYISHVEGLIGLLKQHRKHMPASNSLDDMVSRVIFPFACVTDVSRKYWKPNAMNTDSLWRCSQLS
jgi:hypothetical protein